MGSCNRSNNQSWFSICIGLFLRYSRCSYGWFGKQLNHRKWLEAVFPLHTRIQINPWRGYFLPMAWRWGLLAANGVLFVWLDSMLHPDNLNSYLSIAIYGFVLSVIIIPTIYIQFYILTPGTRKFHRRMWGIVRENSIYPIKSTTYETKSASIKY